MTCKNKMTTEINMIVTGCRIKQDNDQLNTESVQCIAIAYSEFGITEISEQLNRVDQSG